MENNHLPTWKVSIILVSKLESDEEALMDKNEKTISVAEAKLALNELAKTDRSSNASLRPPLWLNVVISGFYGMLTFSSASARHENLWGLGIIISAIGFLLAVAFYFYGKRLQGLKPKLAPKNISEWKFHLFFGFLFAVIFTLAREFSVDGVWWASYLGGISNMLILGYSLHNYATNDYKKGEYINE